MPRKEAVLFRIAILDDYQDIALSMADWSRLGADVAIVPVSKHIPPGEELIATLRPFDAVVLMRERTTFGRAIMENLPALRLIVTTGASNAALDVSAARELGIAVCATRGSRGVASTVEMTWSLILGLARKITDGDRRVRAGQWQQDVGTLLVGKTLGIVGLGHVGAELVPVARALGMAVTAWSQHLDADAARQKGAEPVSRHRLFAEADVVSVHIKLTDRSVRYVSRSDIAIMKPTALLINTSRGQVVDEQALYAALADRRIGGAAVDVYSREPVSGSEDWLRLDNVLFSPHMGYVTRENYEEYFRCVLEDIAAFRAGEPIRTLYINS